jgi:hypothetical protein
MDRVRKPNISERYHVLAGSRTAVVLPISSHYTNNGPSGLLEWLSDS